MQSHAKMDILIYIKEIRLNVENFYHHIGEINKAKCSILKKIASPQQRNRVYFSN